eukprot:CAMPEP_0198319990 /NCGR_PEP_ID=MMETSP1450-20131203/9009_1 /TAXON_ID=753684 ORGANISM="Madagascaria erythrocladiodes, Strain CCMP3234" /NCGR_SAMPLE_ID=MMETSP1450 /ASSEMBLY_ACC=CAM_ASM_001115 /LENGTH=213 /DNA_ID=CAMNT_0044023419 /DNA_START=52 /DNA_END=693 /DNA_ORIENTATION=+
MASSAFVGSGLAALRPRERSVRAQFVQMSAEGAPVSRRRALGLSAAVVAGAVGVAGRADASVTESISGLFFPKSGYNRPDPLAPGKVAVDAEALADKNVQAAVAKLRQYREALADLQAKFKEDPQIPIVADLRAIFEISTLRTALNSANRIFDEDTQKETDIVVRNIIQDIAELENFGALKPGRERTPRRIEKTGAYLGKIISEFDKLLAFFS